MSVMSPLQHLAARGVAVLAIRHERKSGGAVGDGSVDLKELERAQGEAQDAITGLR